MYKCQNLCIKNQDIYLLKSYTSVSSKPSNHMYIKYIYIYIYIYIYGDIYVCVFVCVFYLKPCVCEALPARFLYYP